MKKRVLDNFGICDANVLADNTITPSAKALYALLCCYGDETGLCHPGIPRLAWQLGVEHRTIQRWMAELREKGIVWRDVDTKGKNTKTKLLDAIRRTWKLYDEFIDSTVINLKTPKNKITNE